MIDAVFTIAIKHSRLHTASPRRNIHNSNFPNNRVRFNGSEHCDPFDMDRLSAKQKKDGSEDAIKNSGAQVLSVLVIYSVGKYSDNFEALRSVQDNRRGIQSGKGRQFWVFALYCTGGKTSWLLGRYPSFRRFLPQNAFRRHRDGVRHFSDG
ncbi:hypothetical protein TNCV_2438901 [Trichonephila clavipes]|nr:hypothetical protein TNCV_2438901 [Trichonephila clavipes]